MQITTLRPTAMARMPARSKKPPRRQRTSVWRRGFPRSVLMLLNISIVVLTTTARVCGGPSEAVIERVIDKGIDYLLRETSNHPNWKYREGQIALETYALVVAGASVDHPTIRANFGHLHKEMRRSQQTYGLATYIFACDAAIAQLEDDYLLLNPRRAEALRANSSIGSSIRPYIHGAVKTLLGTQNSRGAWRYYDQEDFDNSNVQFAVLALGVGAKRGVSIPTQSWKKIVDHFVNGQQKNGGEIGDRLTLLKSKEKDDRRDGVRLVKPEKRRRGKNGKGESGKKGDGRTVVQKGSTDPVEDPVVGTESLKIRKRGWDYENKGGASWNMTCAGLSSLLLARENLRGNMVSDDWNNLNQAIGDGYGWVMGNWKPMDSFYGMYSLEKAADIGGVKLFGRHDWYGELSEHLVRGQRGDGSWKGTGKHHENDRIASAFALLILRRATSLITSNPASRVIISGKGGLNDPTDRSWIYIRELDTQLHYPTVLGILKRRPHPKLAKFLEKIVENYPPEWNGELVPPLVEAREKASSQTIRRALSKYLVDLTGLEAEDPGVYRKWHKKWSRINTVLKERKKDGVLGLLDMYKSEEESPTLRRRLIWALVRLKIRSAMPQFVADLEHASADVRLEAYRAVGSFYLDSPPRFDPTGSETARATQIQAIRAWIRRQEKARRG